MTILKHEGLPVPDPLQSYWQTPLLGISDERTTPELPLSSKYVIVGAGITGALTAYKLLQREPSAEILMIEARQSCSGASGRNGGHCRAGDYTKFKDRVEEGGLDEALRMETWEETTVKGIANLVEKESIKCDLRSVETCEVMTDENLWKEIKASVDFRQSLADRYPIASKKKIWSQTETRENFFIPEAYGAVSFSAYSLSPYKFVCALLHLNLAKGMNLQTNTPVLRIVKSGKKGTRCWTLYTPRGVVHAEKVILCTNAYTASVFPGLKEFVIPTRGQVAAIRPGSSISGNPALRRTMGLGNSVSEDYCQSRLDGLSGEGDIIIGGGRRLAEGGEQPVLDDSLLNPVVSKYLIDAMPNYFGRNNWGKDGKVVKEWTGIMGYTKDSHPLIGEASNRPGLFVCAGFNGHGMGLTFQAAEAVVQILLGLGSEVEGWMPKSYRLSRVD